jgi:hypothetical protein
MEAMAPGAAISHGNPGRPRDRLSASRHGRRDRVERAQSP